MNVKFFDIYAARKSTADALRSREKRSYLLFFLCVLRISVVNHLLGLKQAQNRGSYYFLRPKRELTRLPPAIHRQNLPADETRQIGCEKHHPVGNILRRAKPL
jgi:hypothetical protein